MKFSKIKLLFIALFFALSMNICDTAEPGGERIGAVCNDGTTSTATGSGACSHHGGVDYWLYR